MSTKADKPRTSDVARWVADLAAPEPSCYMAEAWKGWRRAKQHARGMLASWGLGLDGKPKDGGEGAQS